MPHIYLQKTEDFEEDSSVDDKNTIASSGGHMETSIGELTPEMTDFV